MAPKPPKDDIFEDERILITLDARPSSSMGLFTITKEVPLPLARKILKLLLKNAKKQ